MAKQTINIGTSANKGDGDPLRNAFDKINDNFNEVYTALGNPSGATSAVLPNTDGTIDLGSADKQWDDVYVKNFIYVNGARIEVTAGGALLVNGGAPAEVQDTVGSVFGDDSTLLVDGVNSSIPKANIEDSTNWDTAFGWGNHSTAGYLTSYTVTESDVTTHQAALSITESQITDLAHYDDTALATRVTTLENAGYITSETDSQELTLAGTDLSISSGNTVDLSGFLTSVPAQTFASLTGTPTTIAGYGITDALELGTTATTALAGNTSIPSVLTDLSISDGTNGQVLTTDGSGSFTFEDASGGSSLQSRIIRTNTTSSLADGAEEDLDITGFKAYALMAITTDKAARVRLYAKAASRTADAARAEGVDPTSDAGLIAEVITTGAETVIISPGAYGFNLEPITTTNIACRVTNKSGSTDTVQVSLLILQLEA